MGGLFVTLPKGITRHRRHRRRRRHSTTTTNPTQCRACVGMASLYPLKLQPQTFLCMQHSNTFLEKKIKYHPPRHHHRTTIRVRSHKVTFDIPFSLPFPSSSLFRRTDNETRGRELLRISEFPGKRRRKRVPSSNCCCCPRNHHSGPPPVLL